MDIKLSQPVSTGVLQKRRLSVHLNTFIICFEEIKEFLSVINYAEIFPLPCLLAEMDPFLSELFGRVPAVADICSS